MTWKEEALTQTWGCLGGCVRVCLTVFVPRMLYYSYAEDLCSSHFPPAGPWMYFWCLAVSPQSNFPTHAKLSVTAIAVPRQWWLVESGQTFCSRTGNIALGEKKSLLSQSWFWDIHKYLACSESRCLVFLWSEKAPVYRRFLNFFQGGKEGFSLSHYTNYGINAHAYLALVLCFICRGNSKD